MTVISTSGWLLPSISTCGAFGFSKDKSLIYCVWTTSWCVVHTQYIKDLSFENPNAPQVLIEG
ncbi:MAG: hypothetical protein EBR92_07995, partial [Alphaproteobacteria bacterium]|nr:hypothetical protein [Alphaproteobacteria bacterium]